MALLFSKTSRKKSTGKKKESSPFPGIALHTDTAVSAAVTSGHQFPSLQLAEEPDALAPSSSASALALAPSLLAHSSPADGAAPLCPDGGALSSSSPLPLDSAAPPPLPLSNSQSHPAIGSSSPSPSPITSAVSATLPAPSSSPSSSHLDIVSSSSSLPSVSLRQSPSFSHDSSNHIHHTHTNNTNNNTHADDWDLHLVAAESNRASLCGHRPQMEDMDVAIDYVALADPPLAERLQALGLARSVGCWGVFDGHGGFRASSLCTSLLLPAVLSQPALAQRRVEEALRLGVLACDAQILAAANRDAWKDGSTGCLALLLDDHLFVANLGDSEIVLGKRRLPRAAPPPPLPPPPPPPPHAAPLPPEYTRRLREHPDWLDLPAPADLPGHQAVLLTECHSPDLPDERRRITDAGGIVIKGRLFSDLAVSRAFGDAQYKRPWAEADYISAEPYVARVPLDATDEFIVIASDGLWDVFKYQEAVDFVSDYLEKKVASGRPVALGPLPPEEQGDDERYHEGKLVSDTTMTPSSSSSSIHSNTSSSSSSTPSSTTTSSTSTSTPSSSTSSTPSSTSTTPSSTISSTTTTSSSPSSSSADAPSSDSQPTASADSSPASSTDSSSTAPSAPATESADASHTTASDCQDPSSSSTTTTPSTTPSTTDAAERPPSPSPSPSPSASALDAKHEPSGSDDAASPPCEAPSPAEEKPAAPRAGRSLAALRSLGGGGGSGAHESSPSAPDAPEAAGSDEQAGGGGSKAGRSLGGLRSLNSASLMKAPTTDTAADKMMATRNKKQKFKGAITGDMLRDALSKKTNVAALLANEAIRRGSRDNTTVIVVFFQWEEDIDQALSSSSSSSSSSPSSSSDDEADA